MEHILKVVVVLKKQGLTSEWLICMFMHRRLQHLMVRQNLMWEYVDVDDPDRHSADDLSKIEIKAHVKDVTIGVLMDFMDGGWPLPLARGFV